MAIRARVAAARWGRLSRARVAAARGGTGGLADASGPSLPGVPVSGACAGEGVRRDGRCGWAAEASAQEAGELPRPPFSLPAKQKRLLFGKNVV